MVVKKCPKCGRTKDLSEFHRESRARDGRQTNCKECANTTLKLWQRKNRLPARRAFRTETEKQCSRCGRWKPFDQFNKNRAEKDGHQSMCRVCQRAYEKARKKGEPI